MSQVTYLIADQQQPAPETLPELLKELSLQHQLDSYQCRQRLVGRGMSLLCQGEPEKLKQISALLHRSHYGCWLVEPTKPKFVPRRIRGLTFDAEQICFTCQKKQVTFHKGASILAVLAEMSGSLVDKNVSQILSSNAYRGKDDLRQLTTQKAHRIILQGKPVLDLYLLDEQQQVADAVRVFPGKFDPKGLGERATVSSVQNLDQVLKLAEEYADQFSLVADFGLVNLPGCNLRRENSGDPETERQNQISLARYGWLLADLERAKAAQPSAQPETENLTGMVTAAMLSQNPTLAAAGQAEDILPVVETIANELNEASPEPSRPSSPPPVNADNGLPTPPEVKKSSRWNSPNFWFGSAGAAVVIIISLLLEIDKDGTLAKIGQHAFTSGAIPFLLSGLLFWSGFYFVRLKRQVENTPTSKVRSVAMGMVEVKGRAVRQYALVSPMSHVPCVFYRLTRYRREKNNQWRVSSISSSDSVPFLLEDDTGRVEVDPAGCRVNAGTKQEGSPGHSGLSHFAGDTDEKWVEEIIVEGTLLYVLGFAAVKKTSTPSLRERKIAALRELKQNPLKFEQFDLNGDGKISEDEWDNARAAVEDQVLRDDLQQKHQRKKQEEHIVIGKKHRRPMIIAETHSEEQLTRRYALYTLPLFLAAAATTGWGIYALFNYIK